MTWEKASPELSQLLESALAPFASQKRMMFGGPAYFVNGNMFAGVYGRTLILRLDAGDRDEIMQAHDQVGPFEPMGRPMREYVALPESLDLPPDELHEWIGRSHYFAASLPAKTPRAPKTPKAAETPTTAKAPKAS